MLQIFCSCIYDLQYDIKHSLENSCKKIDFPSKYIVSINVWLRYVNCICVFYAGNTFLHVYQTPSLRKDFYLMVNYYHYQCYILDMKWRKINILNILHTQACAYIIRKYKIVKKYLFLYEINNPLEFIAKLNVLQPHHCKLLFPIEINDWSFYIPSLPPICMYLSI